MDADAIVVGGGLAGLVATAELIEAGRKVILLDQEPRAGAGRPGVLVVRRLVLRRLARAAAHAHPRLHDLALQDWLGSAGFDRDGGPLAPQVGRGLRRFRRRREARLAARPGPALVPDRRLGRARRLHGHRARQLGAALPRHLGHRARHHRAVRRTRARGREAGARLAALPPSRQWLHHHGRRRRRRARRRPGAEQGRARTGQLAHRGRRFRAQGAGRSSSRRAASAATSISCARAGRSGWARRPSA